MSGSKKPYFKVEVDRLNTTDEHGHRVYVHPEDLKGFWKSARLKVYWTLIGIYLILPWIYINGKQWVLLDIANRQFRIFGFTFLGHDAPYLLLALLMFAFSIAIITAIGGRLWCGWACPQTVFLEAIFRKIEVWVEGNSRKRRALSEGPWTKEKLLKRSVKWGLFTLVALHIAHSAVGYFVGTHYLLGVTMESPLEHWPLFLTTMFIAGVLLFDFGWFREQFCIIMCPYGRFQSVLMDQNSLVVAYDEKRGEPRKQPKDDPEKRGDCVNCYQCVKVCPTGIDIRHGTQMECIACTACIDACDSIMEKLDKPKGLIRYTTENNLNGNETKVLRPRTLIYSAILLILFAASAFLLSGKDDLRLLVHRAQGAPFTVVDSKAATGERQIRNHIQLEFYVQAKEKLELYFEVVDPKWGDKIELVTPHKPYKIRRMGRNVAHIFLKFPEELLNNGSYKTEIIVYSMNDQGERVEEMRRDLTLLGPF